MALHWAGATTAVHIDRLASESQLCDPHVQPIGTTYMRYACAPTQTTYCSIILPSSALNDTVLFVPVVVSRLMGNTPILE